MDIEKIVGLVKAHLKLEEQAYYGQRITQYVVETLTPTTYKVEGQFGNTNFAVEVDVANNTVV